MEVLILIVLIALFVAASVRPNRSRLSEFELRRRLDNKQKGALLEWRRGDLYVEQMTIRRVIIAFLLVVASALIIARYGWAIGLIGAFILTLVYNRIAAFRLIHNIAQKTYNRREASYLRWIDKRRKLIQPFRGVADEVAEHKLASREELLHLVMQSGSKLSIAEKKMITGVMGFGDKKVKDFMTPRSQMEVIGANELLGPLVLDDLHKTGHSHFPVLDGDIDQIVGILHLHNLLTLVNKKTVTVRDVMEPKVLYVQEDQPLSDALSTCIKHRRHLLVVINEFKETCGVITIEDTVEQLTGQPIVDEYSYHDDIKAVAERRIDSPKSSQKSSDEILTVVK